MDNLLDDVEIRVLGSLVEKELTTPEYYPLSLNALVNACNQKSNRDPMMSLDEGAVSEALRSLDKEGRAGRGAGMGNGWRTGPISTAAKFPSCASCSCADRRPRANCEAAPSECTGSTIWDRCNPR